MATTFAILPQDIIDTLSAQLSGASNGVQFLSLPHPRTGCLSLFLPSNDSILEVQAVSPPNGRSWFLKEEVIEDGRLVMMTPIDPAFLLLRLLEAGQTDVFRTADDLFEEITKRMDQLAEDSEAAALKRSLNTLWGLPCILRSLRLVCDVKDFGPETTVYRHSSNKIKLYLRTKVSRIEASKTLGQSRTVVRNLAKDELMDDGRERLLALARTKAAVDMISQYLPPATKKDLLASYDFAELDTYLLQQMQEQAPLKSATNAGKKGGATKAETDKKRKAKGSHGVEQLKKANTTGMAKLSSFFNKAEKAKA
ncbi:ribonuclease H2, subunit B [Coprinopsis sp. MPI-PUGE-AT-0042]|nr:ribonuclease H2, subunit B [Coprinopsis sp. MPI-PUGE-AT-0042]